MTHVLTLVVLSAALTWLSLLLASLIRVKGWTPPGFLLAMGNREGLPPAEGLAGRADRAARNTLEGFVLFTAIALVADAAGIQSPRVALGADLFFWSRVIYLPVYDLGIAGLRTGVWGVGMFGLAMMVSALLSPA